jgi:ATP-dependent DNA ligase
MTQTLCQLAGNWDGKTVPGKAAMQCKLDGWRALYIRDWKGRPGLYTRGGHEIHGVAHILHEIAAWERHAGMRLFLDGEFLVEGPDTLAATKAWCEREWKFGGIAGRFHVFDGFAYVDWQRGGTDLPWHERDRRLRCIGDAVARDDAHNWEWRPGSRGADIPTPVQLVESRHAYSLPCVLDRARHVWAAGGEGVMLKDWNAPYRLGRNRAWMKIGRPWRDKLTRRAAA